MEERKHLEQALQKLASNLSLLTDAAEHQSSPEVVSAVTRARETVLIVNGMFEALVEEDAEACRELGEAVAIVADAVRRAQTLVDAVKNARASATAVAEDTSTVEGGGAS